MKQLFGPNDIRNALSDMAAHILKSGGDSAHAPLAVVGIYTGGAPLAERLRRLLLPHQPQTELGKLDVMLYRDDGALPARPLWAMGSEILFDVDGRRIVLVDDVFSTGRTVRAAIDQLMDFGRPAKIELAVLVDRGGRQLPIRPDYTGFCVDAEAGSRIVVELEELHGTDRVLQREHAVTSR